MEKNRIMLAGTILEKGKHSVEMETSELSFDGNEEYSHTHPVIMTEKDLKAVKKGMKIRVAGVFGKDEETRRGRIEATIVTPNYLGEDVNKGELIGKAHRSFQFFPATPDKQAFGNVIIRLESGLMIRGVCFIPTCHRFVRECTTGSLVQVLGRVQHRPYYDRNGDPAKMIEIVGDDDFTNVLESVELVNPFDVEEVAEAI